MRILLALLMLSFPCLLPGEQEPGSLIEAVEEGNLQNAKDLIAKGADLNLLDKKEAFTPLGLACLYGRVEIVQALLVAGADPNSRDQTNSATALMWASIKNPGKKGLRKGIPVPSLESKNEIVGLMLKAGAKVNERNAWGGTALQWAADAGNVEIVKMLIAAGADVNAGDDEGLTPLMAATNYDGESFAEITQILLSAKANVQAKHKNGNTALMFATNNFRTENTRALLASGARVDEKNEMGFTPLMRAAQMARTEIMRLLIESGADIHATNNDGQSVLAVALQAGFKEAIQILKDAGATK